MEVLALRAKLGRQEVERAARLKTQNDIAAVNLEEQKHPASDELKNQRDEMKLFAQQSAEIKESMDTLLQQIHS